MASNTNNPVQAEGAALGHGQPSRIRTAKQFNPLWG
jgi:hypothetical protein